MNAQRSKSIVRIMGGIVALLSGVFLLRGIQLISAGSAAAVLPIALALYTFIAGSRSALRFTPGTVPHAVAAAGCWLFIIGNLALRALTPPGALRGFLSLVLLSAVIAFCYWWSRKLVRALNQPVEVA